MEAFGNLQGIVADRTWCHAPLYGCELKEVSGEFYECNDLVFPVCHDVELAISIVVVTLHHNDTDCR